jgi:hypothetical protein
VCLLQGLEGIVNFQSRTDVVGELLPPHLLTSLVIRIPTLFAEWIKSIEVLHGRQVISNNHQVYVHRKTRWMVHVAKGVKLAEV